MLHNKIVMEIYLQKLRVQNKTSFIKSILGYATKSKYTLSNYVTFRSGEKLHERD